MPLLKGKSKKDFSKNVATEMDVGKPQKQALAIAYSVKRKSKPKFAKGGRIPEDINDSEMLSKNSDKKALKHSDWDDRVTEEQAQKPSPTKLSRPSGSYKNMRPEEDDLMSSDGPDGYGKQPNSSDDEIGADRSGPAVPDMSLEHSNGRKPYAEGGSVSDEAKIMDMASTLAAHMVKKMYAQGGMATEDHLLSSASPSSDMGKGYAEGRNESDSLGEMGEQGIDHESPHSIAEEIMMRRKFADGGEVDISSNGKESLNGYYKRNEDDVLKENYDDDMKDMSQPEDSNEDGDDLEDEDSHDMVGSIRKKMKKKSAITK